MARKPVARAMTDLKPLMLAIGELAQLGTRAPALMALGWGAGDALRVLLPQADARAAPSALSAAEEARRIGRFISAPRADTGALTILAQDDNRALGTPDEERRRGDGTAGERRYSSIWAS